MHLSFGVPPKEGDFAGSSDTLRDRELNQDFSEPSNWPRMIKFRNVYRDATGKAQAVKVRMRPERPLTAPGAKPSTGVKLNIGAGAVAQIDLVSPDPFTIQIVVGGKVYSASGLRVKDAISGNDSSDARAFFRIGSLSKSGEPTLALQNVYDDDFQDPQSNQPIDLLHRPKKTPTK